MFGIPSGPYICGESGGMLGGSYVSAWTHSLGIYVFRVTVVVLRLMQLLSVVQLLFFAI